MGWVVGVEVLRAAEAEVLVELDEVGLDDAWGFEPRSTKELLPEGVS